MESVGKDKLARLDEERRRRRKQRAEEAIRRLDDVGKQTLLTLQDGNPQQKKLTAGGRAEEAADASGRRPGGLSRVLLEAAAEPEDPRRATRRGKRARTGFARRSEGQAALRQIDQAMQTIQGAVTDTTNAGLKGGLESAARQVTMSSPGSRSSPRASLARVHRVHQDQAARRPHRPIRSPI